MTDREGMSHRMSQDDAQASAAADAVVVARQGSVQVITINRPAVRNALNQAVAVGVAAAVDELDADDDLRAGVLTGAGGTFSAGMDLKAFLAGESPAIAGRGLCGITQAPPRKPLIAAVEGWALAGGCEVALACDLIVAAEDARFGIPEVKRGLVAAAGGLLRLPRRIPAAIALEMALTGDPISAQDAHRYGLVNHLTAAGAALTGALGSLIGLLAGCFQQPQNGGVFSRIDRFFHPALALRVAG